MIKLNIIDSDNENYISDVQFAEIIILLGKSLDMSATCSINNKGIDITLKKNKTQTRLIHSIPQRSGAYSMR